MNVYLSLISILILVITLYLYKHFRYVEDPIKVKKNIDKEKIKKSYFFE